MSGIIGLDIESLAISASRRHVTHFLVIDKSHSMKCKYPVRGVRKTCLQVACEGACSIIDELENGDHVSVLAFGEDIQDVLGGLTALNATNRRAIKTRIMAITTNGATKMYDTILAAAKIVLDITATARLTGAAINEDFGTFWLTVLTDGDDNRSSSTLNDVKEVFRALSQVPSLGINIALIGVNLGRSARNKMEEMSAAGGSMTRFVDARNLQQVTDAFTEVILRMSRERAEIRVPVSGGASAAPSGASPTGLHVRCIGHGRNSVSTVSIGDVGVLKGQDSNGDYIVNFPSQDNWRGSPSDINVDLAAERVRPGALVAIKRAVTQPRYRWGSYVKYHHGLVVAVDHDGRVQLQLGQHPNARATEQLYNVQLQELEVVDNGAFSGRFRGHWPGRLQLGMAVRVPSTVREPSTRWGGLERGEVGYVRCYQAESNSYICDFPSRDGWVGRANDLEVDPEATLVRPGKKVKVRRGVTVPKYGWCGITRSSVGLVVSSRYDGAVVEVQFPEQQSWKGLLSELETVNAGNKHETCICDVCKNTIQGPRYKCMQCADYDMCQHCHDAGSHSRSHKLWRLDRPDSIPVELEARSDRARDTTTGTPPTNFNVGSRVRITGLVTHTALNGRVGTVVGIHDDSGKRIVELSNDDQKVIKIANLEAVFKVGDTVRIRGLSSTTNYNGTNATVVRRDETKGRIVVKPQVGPGNKQLSLRPSNLTLVDEAS